MVRRTRAIVCAFALAVAGVTAADAQTVAASRLCSTGPCNGPGAYMIQASDGNFYGVGTEVSGDSSIFQLTPSGVATNVYVFACDNGCPSGSGANNLIEGGDGNFYGTTLYGGAYGYGVIFKFTPPSTLTVLHSFCMDSGCPEGYLPTYSLIPGSDGNFYGSTQAGGATTNCPTEEYPPAGCGTLFKITPSGTFTNLYIFCQDSSCTAEGGANAPLLEGSDGNFYGTESAGIFQFTPSDSVSLIASVDGPTGLVEDSDGEFYGPQNGPYKFYKISQQGALTNVGTDAGNYYPDGQPLLASNGKFYLAGENAEALLQVTSSGTFTDLLDYGTGGSGAVPLALLQASDGSLVGASENGYIVKYTLSPALPAPVQVTLSNSNPSAGDAETLTYQVLNAFSNTMQQCYLFSTANLVQTALGILPGSLTGTVYGGSINFTAGADNVYTYGVTCGGVESGIAIERVGGAKANTITALAGNSDGEAGVVTVGGTLTLATLTRPSPYLVPLTGTASFTLGSLSLGSVPLSNGAASLNLQADNVAPGTYTITVTYSGDTNYLSSTASISIQVVPIETTTTLTTSTANLTQSQPITLSAAVARSSGGTPTGGTVTFTYKTDVLGTANLVNGVATLVFSSTSGVPPGSYAVVATYNGDTDDYTSSSTAVTVQVSAATSTTLTVTPNPAPVDEVVTLTAKVKETYGGAVPTGSITFNVSGMNFGVVSLDKTGTATLYTTDATVNAASYSVQAVYSGDSVNAASTSSTVALTIQ